MSAATVLENKGEVLVFDADLAALMDDIIKDIPDTQLSSPDHWVP